MVLILYSLTDFVVAPVGTMQELMMLKQRQEAQMDQSRIRKSTSMDQTMV